MRSRTFALGFAWVVTLVATAILARAWPTPLPLSASRVTAPAASPLAPWDGRWRGIFTVYQPDGTLVKRLEVAQEYAHVASDHGYRQEAVFETRDLATGATTVEHAVSTAAADGLTLACRVTKPDGSEVVQRGRATDGAIFWSRDDPEALESFREWIDGDTYCIEGIGLYGDRTTNQPLVFVGRYLRQR